MKNIFFNTVNKSHFSRQYKQNAAKDAKNKKRLKVDSWEIVDEKSNDDDEVLDIRDIEFRMTNDAQRIQALIAGSSASSGRDLIMLKVRYFYAIT